MAAFANKREFGIDEKAYQGIFEDVQKEPKTAIHKQLFEYTNTQLISGIDEVFGNVKYNDANFEVTQKLRANVAQFAALKSFHQTQHLKTAAKHEEPLKAAEILNKLYNSSYMDTEMVHTVRSARMAKNWQKYQGNKDTYPYLEYRPSSAGEQRNEHKKLYGVTKPIEDAFWDSWLPPNDWGCRCSVRQVSQTNDVEVPEDMAEPPKVMRHNAGKTGKVFSDHPMAARLSKEEAKVVNEVGGKLIKNAIRLDIKKTVKVGESFKMEKVGSVKTTADTFRKNLREDGLFDIRSIVLKELKHFISKSKLIDSKPVLKENYSKTEWETRKKYIKEYFYYKYDDGNIKVQFDIEQRHDNQVKLYNLKVLK